MIKQSETKLLLHRVFLLGYVCLLLGIALRNVFHVNIPIILFLALVAGLACIGDESDIIALCIAMMPLSKAFQYKYALLVCIAIYITKFVVFRRIKTFHINLGVFAIFIMIVWELLHAVDINFSFVEYFRSITELIFIIFLFALVKIDNLKFDYIVMLLAITTIFMAFLVLIVQMQTTGATLQTVFNSGYFRLGLANDKIENYGLNYNSNELGAICNAATSAIIVKMHKTKAHWYDLALIATLFSFGFFTLSRTFIFAFAFILIYTIFARKEYASKKIQKILLIAFGVLLVYSTLKLLVPGIVDSLIARFMVEDITNGRAFLLGFYNDHIFSSFKNFFFGVGIQNIQEKIQDMYKTIIEVPHNAYQELIVVWGILGLILFCTLILHIVRSWYNKENKNYIELLPLLVWLFAALAGQFVTSSTKIIELALVYICMLSKTPTTTEKKDNHYEKNNQLY